jgi:hypothetical protein
MSKMGALNALNDFGLRTPTTVSSTTAKRAASAIPNDWDGILFVRCSTRGDPKISRLGYKYDLLQFMESLETANEVRSFEIQQFVDFEFGGAGVVLGRDFLHLELVEGLPLGLLRRGELGYAEQNLQGRVQAFIGSQRSTWRLDGDEIVQGQSSRDAGELFDSVIRAAAEPLQQLGKDGLFEWGWINGEVVWLDWKQLVSADALAALLRSNRFVAKSEGNGDRRTRFELPDLRIVGVAQPSDRWSFERGARLSHAVTYALREGFPSVEFLGW